MSFVLILGFALLLIGIYGMLTQKNLIKIVSSYCYCYRFSCYSFDAQLYYRTL